MVNLELYKVFYTVAKCGSLTKAAEELYISQPAVSQAIKQLETQLGGRLFNRTRKGMELTEPGGKEMFELVKQALNVLDKAEKSFVSLKDQATGVIRICASDTVIKHFLLPYIKEYNSKYKDVKLSFINGTSNETINRLKNQKGDIGFVNLPIEDKEVSLTGKVNYLNDGLFVNANFKDLLGEEIKLDKLEDYPLIMLDQTSSQRRVNGEFLDSRGVSLQPEIEIASLELMIELAKNGMGIACIPKEFVKKEIEEGSLFEVKTDCKLPSRAIGMVLPKNVEITFAVKEFIKLFNQK